MLRFETPIGTCEMGWNATGITRVHLPREPALLRAADAPAEAAEIPPEIRAATAAIARLLAGEPETLIELRISEAGIEPFARRVYAATRAIGPGATTTYGAIARGLGEPGAARAVGAALGANPTPIVVPCHRVLAADGGLTGFSAPGGVLTKRRLLEIEGAPGFTQRALFA